MIRPKLFTLALSSLFLFALVSFPNLVNAQIEVLASEVQTETGEMVDVDIRVVNFVDMISGQFSINYDETVLDFVSVGNFGIDNLTDDLIGTPGEGDVELGEVSFLWIADDIIGGETLTDSTVIFTLTFQATGASGTFSDILFTGDPTEIEFSDVDGMINNPVFFNGIVNIGTVSTITTPNQAGVEIISVIPNPIKEKAYIQLELDQTRQTILSIYDSKGSTVFRQETVLGSGSHTITIPGSVFPATGTYFLDVATKAGSVKQRLVVID
jgi:hypothetical protein